MAGWNKLLPAPNLGLPYHGLVTDGVLTLPNSDTITGLDPQYGPSYVLRHPNAPGIVRSGDQATADTAAGRAWRDYALLGDRGRYLANAPLDGSIYIDPAGTCWLIEITCTVNQANVGGTLYPRAIFAITLKGIFGRFGRDYPSVNRALVTNDFYILRRDIPDFVTNCDRAVLAFATPNETGSAWKYNVYLVPTGVPSGGFIKWQNPAFSFGTRPYGVLESIFTITISGTGSTTAATLGDGISASVSREEVVHTYTSGTFEAGTASTLNVVQDGSGDWCVQKIESPSLGNDATWEYVVAEVYRGNAVERMTGETNKRSWAYTYRDVSGCATCPGPTGSTISGINTYVVGTRNENTFTATGHTVSGISGEENTYVWDGGYYLVCNPITLNLTNPDPPGTPTSTVVYDTDNGFLEIEVGDVIYTWEQTPPTAYWHGMTASAPAGKTSVTDICYTATEPEQSLIVASLDPVSYV